MSSFKMSYMSSEAPKISYNFSPKSQTLEKLSPTGQPSALKSKALHPQMGLGFRV